MKKHLARLILGLVVIVFISNSIYTKNIKLGVDPGERYRSVLL
ncbi:MAG: hypothetical protein Q3988_01495 [Gemella sp.]|nr:hypothetical protein [Gemella sp.]